MLALIILYLFCSYGLLCVPPIMLLSLYFYINVVGIYTVIIKREQQLWDIGELYHETISLLVYQYAY